MTKRHIYLILVWSIRAFLAVVILLDLFVVGNVAFHYYERGWDGVRAWIGHLEQVNYPENWLEGGDRLEGAIRRVQSAYEHFAIGCLVLIFATWLGLRLHSWLKNRLKTLPASPSTMPPDVTRTTTAGQA
jgi:hypothetical protein